MMCDFIARTNWSKIKSKYFVDTIIISGLSYYTNIMITATFINQATLCHAFFFFSPENYLHKSGAIFHINLCVFNCWETESARPSPLVPVKSNLSDVPTSLPECFSADLEVSSCSKIRFLLYL